MLKGLGRLSQLSETPKQWWLVPTTSDSQEGARGSVWRRGYPKEVPSSRRKGWTVMAVIKTMAPVVWQPGFQFWSAISQLCALS